MLAGRDEPLRARRVGAAAREDGIAEELIRRFLDEAAVVEAGVQRVPATGLADAVAALVAECRIVVVDAALDEVAAAVGRHSGEVVRSDDRGAWDRGSSWEDADAGVVLALGAIADTGTVVVGLGTGMEGLAAVLPPRSVLVVPADTIHPDLGSALSWLAPLLATAGTRVAFITGPSRTSDIELTPVVGVHGPLQLEVVVVDG